MHALGSLAQLYIVEIIYLRMPRLNLPQPPLHLVAVFQSPRDDGLLQTLESFFHTAGKTISDGPLFFLAPRRTAQDIRLLALRNGNLLHFHFRPYLGPILLVQQLCFKLLHLATRRAHQVLAAALADRCQVLFADDAAIEHPNAARFAILALHHAQNGLHGRNVGAVAIEGFIAEGEAFAVDNQRDDHLLAVWTMIARIAASHHRIVLRRAFDIRARQVIEQHVE